MVKLHDFCHFDSVILTFSEFLKMGHQCTQNVVFSMKPSMGGDIGANLNGRHPRGIGARPVLPEVISLTFSHYHPHLMVLKPNNTGLCQKNHAYRGVSNFRLYSGLYLFFNFELLFSLYFLTKRANIVTNQSLGYLIRLV